MKCKCFGIHCSLWAVIGALVLYFLFQQVEDSFHIEVEIHASARKVFEFTKDPLMVKRVHPFVKNITVIKHETFPHSEPSEKFFVEVTEAVPYFGDLTFTFNKTVSKNKMLTLVNPSFNMHLRHVLTVDAINDVTTLIKDDTDFVLPRILRWFAVAQAKYAHTEMFMNTKRLLEEEGTQ